jgi:predicted Zn-dependent protease
MAAEEIIEWTQYPIGILETGRYAAVLDGPATAQILGWTLLPSLVLSRVLGAEENQAGTSWLAPIDTTLGQPIFAPNFHLDVPTGAPHFGAAQWDAEGVATTAFPLIEHGAVVDYLTTRSTVHAMADWYATRGRPLQPQGVSTTPSATDAPYAMPGAAVMRADPSGPSLADLAKALTHGILVRSVGLTTGYDPQGKVVQFRPQMLFEVQRGQIVRRILNVELGSSTKKFFAGLLAVGNAGTHVTSESAGSGGMPYLYRPYAITAPAVHVRALDLTHVKR